MDQIINNILLKKINIYIKNINNMQYNNLIFAICICVNFLVRIVVIETLFI